MLKHPLKIFNLSAFLQTQIFMLPVLLLFYQQNGLTVGDFFLFQGIFSLTALLFEIPAGYVGDIFPRKNILILSYSFFLMRLVLWLFFAHLGYWVILAGEIFYSASKAFYSGVADGYVYDYLKEKGKSNKMLKKYGRLNFCMSIGTAISSLLGAYFYSSFSQWTEANWGRNYGFLILILIEIIFNTAAIALLFMLPKLPSAKKKVNGLLEKYKDLFHITRYAFSNTKIKYHMFYSGLLAGTTMVFVWSFQPLMKTAMIPVSLFGVVYFANHFFRAMAGYLLHKTMRLFTLSTLGIFTFVMFGVSFLIAIEMAYIGNPAQWISFVMLFFICLTIGFQLSFTLASTTRIHSLIESDVRSTVVSVNNMIGRMTAGFFLILFKVLLDGVSMQTTFLVALAVFSFGLYPLYRIVQLSKESS